MQPSDMQCCNVILHIPLVNEHVIDSSTLYGLIHIFVNMYETVWQVSSDTIYHKTLLN